MKLPPKTALSFVGEELACYCEASTSEEPEICRRIREASHGHPKAHWTSGPLVGTLLKTLTCLTAAKRVLDIGTYLGYSAAYMASANSVVRVVSLEHDSELAERARALLSHDDIGNRIQIVRTEAGTWLAAQQPSGFDVVFFDSNRSDLITLYPLLTKAVRPGGVLVMDNACLRGKVLSPSRPWEHDTVEFNRAIQQDRQFITMLLPVRDGVLVAYRSV